MKVLYRGTSRYTKEGIMLVGAFMLLPIAFFIYSLYMTLTTPRLWLPEMLIAVMIFVVFLMQAIGKYTYELTESSFIIKEKGLFGTKQMEVPYSMIDGVYPFKQQLQSPIKFRYKYRKFSSTDDRKVWAMAYSIEGGKKLKHGRILLKADDEFYETLEQFLPKRVRVPEEDIVLTAYIREDAYLNGDDFQEYWNTVMNKSEETE